MKTRWRRPLALLLTLSMVLSLLSGNVWATDLTTENNAEIQSENTVEETAQSKAELETEYSDSVSKDDSEEEETPVSDAVEGTQVEGSTEETDSEAPEAAAEEDSMQPTLMTAVVPDGIIDGGGSVITRGQWFHNLTVLFDLSTDNDGVSDPYYPDVTTSTQYFSDIWAVIDAGAVNVAAGSELRPNDPLTRDFAASTLNYFLGHQLESTSYTFTDASDCEDPYNAQVAVNQSWMKLSGGKFLPRQNVTSAEVQAMAKDAAKSEQEITVTQNTDNTYTFADGVIVFPKDVAVSYNDTNTIVTINNTKTTVSKGDTFVVWPTDLPSIYVANQVTQSGGKQIVTFSDADIDKALLDINASGSEDVDLSDFEGADGFKAEYIETQRQSDDAAKLFSIEAKKGSVIASKSFKLSNGAKSTVAVNLSKLKLNYKSSGKNNAYVSISGNYKVVGSVSIDVIAETLGSSSLTIGTITLDGIGKITVSLDLSLNGKLSCTTTGTFEVGLYNNAGAVSLIHRINKREFYSDVEANASMGIKIAFGVDILIAKGEIYATVGLAARFTSHNYNDGKSPAICSQLNGWLFAEVGANASIGIILKKNFHKSYAIFDAKNSPAKLMFHWEDGKRVYHCTRGNEAYLSNINSKYGNSSYGGGSSTGMNGAGQVVTIYTYTLDDDQNATITGYKGNAMALTIPDTIDGYKVVAIGDSAFGKNKTLRTVTIPNSITSIGSHAFYGCTNLYHVKLPDGLTFLGSGVFANDTSLVSVNIPKDVKIHDYVRDNYSGPFAGCSSLTEPDFPVGITTVPMGLFKGCDGLISITIPDTVTVIGTKAFDTCKNLQKVVLPDKLNQIDDYGFSNCPELDGVVLPENIEYVGTGAFLNCTKLSSINVTKKVETGGYVGEKAYPGPFGGCDQLTKLTYSDGIKKIPNGYFERCTGLIDVVIPDTVTEIGSHAFGNCTNLQTVKLSPEIRAINAHTFEGCAKLKTIAIPEKVKRIEDDSFSFCSKLEQIVLPEQLEYLGVGVFSNCTALESINIPKKVKVHQYVGNREYPGPFVNCSALTKVTFAENMMTIPKGLFYQCTGLKEIVIPDTVRTIEEISFSVCSNLEKVTLPDGLKEIDSFAFEYCNLKSIVLPDKLEYLGIGAFDHCMKLTSAYIPAGAKTSENTARNKNYPGPFRGCEKLTDVKFGNGITTIPCGLFYQCSGLEEITFPDTVTTVEHDAFASCTSLKDIHFGEKLNKIGDYVFYDCTSLEEVSWPASLTTIPMCAFCNCVALKTVKLPDSLEHIYGYAFENCYELNNVVLPAHLEYLGAGAFKSCKALSSINIPINMTSDNTNDWGPFSECESLNEVHFADGITVIPKGLFFRCTGLKTITLPDTILSLEPNVFYGCEELGQITLSKRLRRVGDSAFCKCYSLKEITLPDTVEVIEDYGFEKCEYLKSITFGAKLKTIGDAVFDDCSDLNEVHYGGSEAGRKKIAIGSYNQILEDATWHYGNKDATDPMSVDLSTCSITLSKDRINSDDDFLAITQPSVLVKNGNTILVKDLDYVVNYSDYYDVGTASVTVTGIGNCTGSVTKQFSIVSNSIPGDVTGDGDVTIADVVKVNRYVVGKVNLTADELAAADVTDDGDVTIADVVKINRFVVGKITSL